MARYEAQYLKRAVSLESGHNVDMDWKYYVYGDGACFLELRGLFYDFFQGKRKDVQANRIMKEQAELVGMVMQACDIVEEVSVLPSNLAMAKRGMQPSEYTRQEWCCSTQFGVGILVAMKNERRLQEDSAVAEGLLQCFFGKVLEPENWKLQRLLQALRDCAGEWCSERDAHISQCSHMLEVARASEEVGPTANPWLRLTKMLSCLLTRWRACGGCKAAFALLVYDIAAEIDAVLGSRCFPTEPEGAKPRKASTTHARVDEDFKKLVTTVLPRAGRITSGSQYLRVTGMANEREARTWEQLYVTRYRIACTDLFKLKGVLHVATDAARNGQPKEETCLFFGFEPSSDMGCYMQPMVRG